MAISSEEEGSRIFGSFAAYLRAAYPASAAVFDGMAAKERSHGQKLMICISTALGIISC
ncbi:rubrerythrin family protein, partial [Rhodobacteraceae bacterium]|nr:rubrerythrin family protein [Paracoccaceae bacterium]